LEQKVPAEVNCFSSFAMFWTSHSLAVYYYFGYFTNIQEGDYQ
jgi:hypothetical protein